MTSSAHNTWFRFVKWWLERRVVAGVLFLLVILSGIYVAPFDWQVGAIDRSPIPVDAIPDIGEINRSYLRSGQGVRHVTLKTR